MRGGVVEEGEPGVHFDKRIQFDSNVRLKYSNEYISITP